MQSIYQDKAQLQATIEQLLTKDSSVDSFLILWEAFESFNSRDEAYNILEQGLLRYPKNKELYLLLGTLYGNQDYFEKAITVWQKGSLLFPDNMQFLENINKAKALQRNKD